ncbi:MAG: hypothetical protein GY906_28920 [bacterium]|nr:hypothetical protein [bacterium]
MENSTLASDLSSLVFHSLVPGDRWLLTSHAARRAYDLIERAGYKVEAGRILFMKPNGYASHRTLDVVFDVRIRTLQIFDGEYVGSVPGPTIRDAVLRWLTRFRATQRGE